MKNIVLIGIIAGLFMLVHVFASAQTDANTLKNEVKTQTMQQYQIETEKKQYIDKLTKAKKEETAQGLEYYKIEEVKSIKPDAGEKNISEQQRVYVLEESATKKQRFYALDENGNIIGAEKLDPETIQKLLDEEKQSKNPKINDQ